MPATQECRHTVWDLACSLIATWPDRINAALVAILGSLPAWHIGLHETSETAAQWAPILAVILAALQIAAKARELFWRPPKEK
jgi:hypothetical protein